MSTEAYCHLATNPGKGGVSVIYLWGDGDRLRLVGELLGKPELAAGDLVYGWLRDETGNPLDEVLLACPRDGLLILSGHGGTANTLSLLKYFVKYGFNEIDTAPSIFSIANEWNTFIAACRTEGQLAMILKLRDLILYKKVTAELALHKAADVLRPRRVCLVGAPNTGKSSLLNRLCGGERVLVSPHEGTTLDAVEHWVDLGGYDCVLVDTAGFRDEAGVTEREAMNRAQQQIAQADLVIFVGDGSREWSAADDKAAFSVRNKQILLALNKSDVLEYAVRITDPELRVVPTLRISCRTGEGIDLLVDAAVDLLGGSLG